MIKAIALDLDKTLLRSDSTMSDYTISILAACQAQGIKVIFATARSQRAAGKMLAQFTPDVFAGYGGSLVQAGNEVIYRAIISMEISNALIAEALITPAINSIWASSEVLSLTNNLHARAYDVPGHYKFVDFSKENTHSYLKISLESTDTATVQHIASHYPMLTMLRYTGEDLYRFAHCNATKWQAIKAIATFYGISTGEFAAFGDDVIDIEMITNCGTGVAVANAVDTIKAAADYICDSNDNDGVAKWIAEHILDAK